jgi:putative ABC transport system permease protein
MQNSWPMSNVAHRLVFYPGMPATNRRVRYLVRAEPGMVESLYTTLEEELLRVNEGRIVQVHTMAELKGERYGDLLALNKLLWGVSIMLVAVTSLGIIGLTSFSVTQRTRQIGTRRALGATRLAILRYFLLENWIVTGAGLLLGLGLTYGLNFALIHFAEVPKIGWPLVAGGMLALWLIGLLAALAPAARGTLVQPVIATRTV